MSEDFGSYLKHERELRGVPLDEIAQSTKISISFLRALEESRFEDLPGEVFIKGFIRSYGQAIGSNVDELLAAYHESSSKRQDTETSHTATSPPKEEQPERHSGFPMKAVSGFVAALLIIIGGIYWVTSEKGENRQSQQTSLATPATIDNSLPVFEGNTEPAVLEEASVSAPEVESPKPDSSQTKAAGSSESPVKVNPDKALAGATGAQEPVKNTVTVSEKSDIIKDLQDQTVSQPEDVFTEMVTADLMLRLVIRVNENAWFNLTVDDRRDPDFILPAGGSKTIEAKNAIVMTIGNRRATELILNDQPLELPESPDNVIRNLAVNAELLN